jgi:glycosyltransferase involved in cell wall biosynthesis
MLISIVIPCYNEEPGLPRFYEELTRVTGQMAGYAFEYIFVDDGSRDGTLGLLRQMAQTDKSVRYLSFSRNFGKESAMMAGLEAARGGWVAIMDADLQDPPGLLPKMAEILSSGEADAVATRRVTRKGEPPIRSLAARMFYRLMGRISKTEIVDGARDYRMMTRAMTDAVLKLREVNRFSKGIFSWVGFTTHWLPYENVERAAGETKWSFFRLLAYSMEGIAAFSTAPLVIASMVGLVFFVLSFIAIIFVIIRQLIFQNSAYGWASMICVIFMVSGIQLFCMGILGQYLSRAYLETKKRPLYIVKESSGDPDV